MLTEDALLSAVTGGFQDARVHGMKATPVFVIAAVLMMAVPIHHTFAQGQVTAPQQPPGMQAADFQPTGVRPITEQQPLDRQLFAQPTYQQPVVQPQYSQHAIAPLDDSPLYIPYVEANGRIGNSYDIVQGALFLPLHQTDHELLFADFRYHWAEPKGHEGNYGLGYRSMDHQWVYGVYGYFDRIRTQNTNYFNQLTIGMEWMSVNWDFRVNGYIPDRDPKVAAGNTTAAISGGTVVVQNAEERAYYGIDAEMGRLLSSSNNGQTELRAFITGYYFNRTEEGYPEVMGGRARLEYRLYDLPWLGYGSRLMLGGQYQYDDVRKDVASGLVSLRVPLSREPSRRPTRLQRRMMNPIVRDINVITHTGYSVEEGLDASTGQSIFVIDQSTADPSATIASSADLATVLVNGTVRTSTPIVVSGGRTLRGNEGLLIRGARTGNATLLTASDATIVGLDPTQDVISILDSGSIKSLTLSGGLNSIAADSATVNIDDVIATGAANRGIALTGTGLGSITNNEIASGLDLGSFAGDVSNNTVTANLQSAITAADFSGQLSNNTATGDTLNTLHFQSVAAGASISNNNLATNSTGSAIKVDNRNDGLISGNMFTGNHLVGLNVGTNAGSITANQFDNITETGFAFGSIESGSVSANTIGGSLVTGLGFRSMIDGDVSGNQFTGTQQFGVEANNQSGGTISANSFNTTNQALVVNTMSGGFIQNNAFTSASENAFSLRIIEEMTGGTITNNTFGSSGYGIYSLVGGTISGDALISSNTFQGSGSLEAIEVVMSGGTISNNQFQGDYGIGINSSISGGTIESNTFENVTSGANIQFSGTANGTVANNTFHTNRVSTNSFGIWMSQIDTLGGSVDNNAFTGSFGVGIRAVGGSANGNTFENITRQAARLEPLSGGTYDNNTFGGTHQKGVEFITEMSGGSFSGNSVNSIETGLVMTTFSGGTIASNTFGGTQQDQTVLIETMSGGTLSNNTFSSNANAGLKITSLQSGSVAGNTFSGTVTDAIDVSNFTGGSVSGNTFANVSNSVVTLNTLAGSIDNNTFGGNPTNGIRITNLTNGSVSGNTLAPSSTGIDINTATGTIDNNTISGSPASGITISTLSGSVSGNTVTGSLSNGIDIDNAGGSTIANNTVSNSAAHGIRVATANGADINGNTVSNNALDGLRLENITGSIIDGQINNNVANGNSVGIHILSLTGSTISNNSADGNTTDGFQFDSWTFETLARGNTSNNNGGNGFTWVDPFPQGWFEDATANGNGGNGIQIPSITNGHFNNNTANNNTAAGFAIGSTFGIIEGNTASGNADNSTP